MIMQVLNKSQRPNYLHYEENTGINGLSVHSQSSLPSPLQKFHSYKKLRCFVQAYFSFRIFRENSILQLCEICLHSATLRSLMRKWVVLLIPIHSVHQPRHKYSPLSGERCIDKNSYIALTPLALTWLPIFGKFVLDVHTEAHTYTHIYMCSSTYLCIYVYI